MAFEENEIPSAMQTVLPQKETEECAVSEELPEEEPKEETVKEEPPKETAPPRKPRKHLHQFTKYYLSVLFSFASGFLLFIILQFITEGKPQASLVEAFVCFLVCLLSCEFLCENVVFKGRLRSNLPILEFVVAHILASSVWQLMINSMLSHAYSTWEAILIPTVINIIITYFFYKDVVFRPEVKHINRRWILAIIAMVLCIPLALQSFVSTVYHMLNTSNYVTYTEATSRLEGFSSKSEDGSYDVSGIGDYAFPVHWEDRWFTEDLTEYNPDLAYIAGVLSTAAYKECHAQIGTLDFSSPDFWGSLGFEWLNITSFRYRSEPLDKFANLLSGDSNGAAYVVAGKELVTEDGSKKNLLVVSICGSIGFDFADDLFIGNHNYMETGHESFSNAANELATGLMGVKDRLIDDDTIIFLCGHSRGAAIANLLAVELGERLKLQGSGAKVCAYTLACPNAAGASKVAVTECDSIFNVLNPYDMVTLVPFESWGFARFGEDVLLFDSQNGLPDEKVQEVLRMMSQYSGKDVKIDYSEGALFDSFFQKFAEAAGDGPSSLANPLNVYRLIHSARNMKVMNYLSSHKIASYLSMLLPSAEKFDQ